MNEAGAGNGSSKSSAGHEDAECAKCNHCVYIGCVRCSCDPSVVCCHLHFTEFCQCPVSEKWFEFRFDLSWFERMLKALVTKVNAAYVTDHALSQSDGNTTESTGDTKSAAQGNPNELQTDLSAKNYEILCQSTDDIVVTVSCNLTALLVRKQFEERYGKILGDYTNQLVRKLSDRFPRLSERKMSGEELAHLRHACECVVWGHFNTTDSNNNLAEVRRYFEILCDYNAVSKMLGDTLKCYSDVQEFYGQLQRLQGQQDQIEILLQNQPRFPKKLCLDKVAVALKRAQNGEIKVDLGKAATSMPNILTFMRQQEQILQNALNGILSTTWECKYSLHYQARSIVNFIPGNFSHSYWNYLQV